MEDVQFTVGQEEICQSPEQLQRLSQRNKKKGTHRHGRGGGRASKIRNNGPFYTHLYSSPT